MSGAYHVFVRLSQLQYLAKTKCDFGISCLNCCIAVDFEVKENIQWSCTTDYVIFNIRIFWCIIYIYIYIIHRIYLKASPMFPPQPWNISSNALCKESPSLQVDLMLRWKCPISPVWHESILGLSKSNSYFTNCNDILYGNNIWHMVYDYIKFIWCIW